MNKNYEEVIEKITKNIEKGVMPWTTIGAPRNFTTNKKYQGINCFILLDHNFTSNLLGTFKKITENWEK